MSTVKLSSLDGKGNLPDADGKDIGSIAGFVLRKWRAMGIQRVAKGTRRGKDAWAAGRDVQYVPKSSISLIV